MTAADQPTTEPSVLGTDRDTLARLIARAQDADGFYDDIQAWESQEDWEREAHPDNYPDMAYEDLAEYQNIADRVLSDLSRLAPAAQPAAETEVQWGVRDLSGGLELLPSKVVAEDFRRIYGGTLLSIREEA